MPFVYTENAIRDCDFGSKKRQKFDNFAIFYSDTNNDPIELTIVNRARYVIICTCNHQTYHDHQQNAACQCQNVFNY